MHGEITEIETSGGAGNAQHMVEAVTKGGADAVLAASIFHFGEVSIGEAKQTLAEATVVHTSRPDGVLVLPMRWRVGFHAVFGTRGIVRNAFGHAGYNGSGAWASPNHQAALAFTVNAGTGTPVGDMRLIRLTGVALACLKANRKRAA